MIIITLFDSLRTHSVVPYCSIVGSSAAILTHFHGAAAATALTTHADSVPDMNDMQLWSEILGALKQVEFQTDRLRSCSDFQLSLVWYLVDWLVYTLEVDMRHSVYSVTEQTEIKIDSSHLLPSVKNMRETIRCYLYSYYLNRDMKIHRKDTYELLCKATLLDPRTKDFRFFKSSEFLTNALTMTRSLAADSLHADAVALVKEEMVRELTDIVHRDDISSSILSLWNILRSIRAPIPMSRPVLHGGGSLPDHTVLERGKTIEDDDLLNMIGGGGGGGAHSSTGSGRKRKSLNHMNGNIQKMSFEDFPPLSNTPEAMMERRRRIDIICQDELERYISTDVPCSPAEILHLDMLTWWARNAELFPVMSLLSRRYAAINTVAANSTKVKKVLNELYRKDRGLMSRGLSDSVIFLYFNGILSTSVPDDMIMTGNGKLTTTDLEKKDTIASDEQRLKRMSI